MDKPTQHDNPKSTRRLTHYPARIGDSAHFRLPSQRPFVKEGGQVVLSANISFKPVRGRSEIIDQRTGKEITARSTASNRQLIQTLTQAEFWRAKLARHPEKPLEKITAEYGIKPKYIRRLLNAAYLAPAIKRAILQGTQPVYLQVQDLIAARSLDWHAQMQELGFENPTINA